MIKIPVIIISLMVRKTKCVHCLVALNRITTTTLCKACPCSMCKVMLVTYRALYIYNGEYHDFAQGSDIQPRVPTA